MNQFESASFQTSFENKGCQVVKGNSKPDVIIINTCAVTAKAGAQSRQVMRKAARENPKAKIIITGCYSQIEAEEIAAMDELQGHSICVVGNDKKAQLVEMALHTKNRLPFATVEDIASKKTICDLPVKRFQGRTRAFLRVQDGCENYCSYCIVPYTRGKNRSLPLKEVLRQAHIYHEEGHLEIVVTGIHVGHYGNDLKDGINLSQIMKRLCKELPNVRFRLSSIEPMEITDELLNIIEEFDNFMPHLHIPLQSGDDTILLRMNRRYTTKMFSDVLELCKKKIPNLAIGIDVLAGFPGEDQNHFENTLNFLKKAECSYLHVFPYSKRKGTPAASFENQVAKSEKERRVSLLRDISEQKKHFFYSKFIKDIRPVLVEKKRNKQGLLKGFTDNYIPISFKGDKSLMNSIVKVELHEVDDTTVFGSLRSGDE